MNKKSGPGLFIKLAGDKWIVRLLGRINVLVYRISGGRLGNKIEGSPVCLLTTVGHRSGKRKTIALMYTPVGDKVLLVASLGGAPRNPAWYYNVKANPTIEVQLGRCSRKMIAHEASPDERTQLWPLAVANFPAFAEYQKKTARTIPVMVCEPVP